MVAASRLHGTAISLDLKFYCKENKKTPTPTTTTTPATTKTTHNTEDHNILVDKIDE